MLKQIPNALTIIRLLLIAPFLLCLFHQQFTYAFYICLIAAVSDVLDGRLARWFAWQTDLGKVIDPMADKLLIATSFISLAILHLLPWWLVILIFARDCIISLGFIAWCIFIPKKPDLKPTNISKMNTVLQMSLVVLCLAEQAFAFQVPHLLLILVGLTATTTVITLLDYVWTWGKKAWQQRISLK